MLFRSPDSLVAGGQIVRSVTDPVSAGEIGRYALAFTGGGLSVAVISVGYTINKPNRCQEIDASIDSFSGAAGGTQYYVKSFDHLISASCGLLPNLTWGFQDGVKYAWIIDDD